MPHPESRGPSAVRLHALFLKRILPRVISHGQVCFRGHDAEQREEFVAEMVALSWRWFLRLSEQGRKPEEFPTALARYAALQVRCGRGLCGQEPGREPLSRVARLRRGFSVVSLPDHSTLGGSLLEEALHDNTRTPVPDQVSFRLDWPAWLSTRTERDRRIIEDLALGEGTLAVASRHGLSPGRVSQKRREYLEDWRRFTDPPVRT